MITDSGPETDRPYSVGTAVAYVGPFLGDGGLRIGCTGRIVNGYALRVGVRADTREVESLWGYECLFEAHPLPDGRYWCIRHPFVVPLASVPVEVAEEIERPVTA